jgi:hypothetical protein
MRSLMGINNFCEDCMFCIKLWTGPNEYQFFCNSPETKLYKNPIGYIKKKSRACQSFKKQNESKDEKRQDIEKVLVKTERKHWVVVAANLSLIVGFLVCLFMEKYVMVFILGVFLVVIVGWEGAKKLTIIANAKQGKFHFNGNR